MRVIEQSRQFNKREMYKLTKGDDTVSIKILSDGATLFPTDYLIYEDDNKKRGLIEVLAVIGKNENGEEEIWSGQSKTFRDRFLDIWADFYGDPEPFGIIKKSGITKNGDEYVTCTLA